MPSRFLYIPLVLIAGLLIYLGQDSQNTYTIVLLPVVVLAGVILFFIEPIFNWWWWERFPPDLPPAVQPLLEKYCVFYRELSDDRKRLFRTRAFLYVQNKNWKPQGWEKIPEDIKLMIAASAVRLHFRNGNDYLTEHLENIVVYPSRFPSPAHPQDWHAAETYEPDGVLLFSAQHITRGFMESHQYLDIGLYELARDYWQKAKEPISFPGGPAAWKEVMQISNFQKEALQKFIGLTEVDLAAVLTCLFFTHPVRFAQANATLFSQLRAHFG